ncbi:hypothetical protein M0654_14135 [Rhizobium sp. NTR19]|uniref:Uncharacterized protein n=1 Tax=Neorhizobium turbinariae TaxID=2937795 RepID=A0ABT0ITB4_9HYPH|nr:hypothetical protein [Neorhizobium turbinariae]MCK8781122.1 hypothetical protein [Neorhizobium turbinariae]
MQRAMDALADMRAGREALEALERHQMQVRMARSSFIVEAAASLAELRSGRPLMDLLTCDRLEAVG